MQSNDAQEARPRLALSGQQADRVTAGKDSPLTLRALLAGRDFRALWSGNAASVAAGTAQSLALSVWVYDRTRSAFLAASALVVSVVPQLVAGLLLLSLADRIPRSEER